MIPNKAKIFIFIIIFSVLFLLIVPISLLLIFIGKDAWFIIKAVTLIIVFSIIMIPIYTLGGLARSGAPVSIADFVNSVEKQIKAGLSALFSIPRK